MDRSDFLDPETPGFPEFVERLTNTDGNPIANISETEMPAWISAYSAMKQNPILHRIVATCYPQPRGMVN